MPTTPRRVFLSYAQDDGQAFARDLSVQLSNHRHLPWRDIEQLTSQGGARWVHELTQQLLSADVVVVILTPQAYVSQYVEGEWMKALDHGLQVVPAMFLECGVPLPLTPLQFIDFRRDRAAGLTGLLDRLAQLDRPYAVTERDRQTLQSLRRPERKGNRQPESGARRAAGACCSDAAGLRVSLRERWRALERSRGADSRTYRGDARASPA